MRLALVHDLAESIVGDITPHQGVTKSEKYRMESVCLLLSQWCMHACVHLTCFCCFSGGNGAHTKSCTK